MHKHWICLNVETVADEAALPLLAEPLPRKGTKDEAKKAAQIEAKREAQLAAMSLDPYACRIVCVAVQTSEMEAAITEEIDERQIIRLASFALRDHRPIITFNGRTFDLPVLATRARLLNYDWPDLDLRRFGSTDVVDIYERLTFGDTLSNGVIPRKLHDMAARFGIDVQDDVRGHQIGALVAAGEWDKVRHHCANNVRLTVELARRLGVIKAQEAKRSHPDDPWFSIALETAREL